MLISYTFLLIITITHHGALGATTDVNHGKTGPIFQPGETTFLRIGMLGTTPYFFVKDNKVMGSDMLMVELLSKKLGFSYKVTVVPFFEKMVQMVRKGMMHHDDKFQWLKQTHIFFRPLMAHWILPLPRLGICIIGLIHVCVHF